MMIECGAVFYEEYRRALGEAIWSDILKRARRQLARIGA